MKRVEFDKGEKKGNKLLFPLETKIREFKKGVDYEVDKTGNYYTILSERLKKIVWPGDYLNYAESVVAIDREGKINSWRISAEKEGSIDPYKRFTSGGYEEIMNGMGDNKLSDSFGNDRQKVLLDQVPFEDKKKFEEVSGERFKGSLMIVDKKNRVGIDLERQKGLIEEGRGRNDLLNISQTPNYDNWTKEQFINEINNLKSEIENLKNNQTLTSSEKQQRLQQKLEKVQSLFNSKETQQPTNGNSFAPLFIGGTVLAVVGLVSVLVIRKTAKIKKKS